MAPAATSMEADDAHRLPESGPDPPKAWDPACAKSMQVLVPLLRRHSPCRLPRHAPARARLGIRGVASLAGRRRLVIEMQRPSTAAPPASRGAAVLGSRRSRRRRRSTRRVSGTGPNSGRCRDRRNRPFTNRQRAHRWSSTSSAGTTDTSTSSVLLDPETTICFRVGSWNGAGSKRPRSTPPRARPRRLRLAELILHRPRLREVAVMFGGVQRQVGIVEVRSCHGREVGATGGHDGVRVV